MVTLLNTYNDVRECHYKNEQYSVRDNGAVLRHTPDNKRTRPLDSKWTFGKANNKTGYLEIASIRVHRIVATAFHGEPPTNQHVVDHIDTNRQNNRPENLRWVTKLENVMLNPITVRRIEIACGCSIEEFLSDPSKFRNKFQEPNYSWMCSVSAQEALTCKKRLLAWAGSDNPSNGGSLGEWIYNRSMANQSTDNFEGTLEYIDSLTPNAVQNAQNWKTPSEFPCCPQERAKEPIGSYIANLRAGNVFSRNQYTNSIIQHFAISDNQNVLWIMCKSGEQNPIKPYSLAEVTFQNNFFVHDSLGTFFEKEGAEKQFTLAQGLEWTGGETIDDFC